MRRYAVATSSSAALRGPVARQRLAERVGQRRQQRRLRLHLGQRGAGADHRHRTPIDRVGLDARAVVRVSGGDGQQPELLGQRGLGLRGLDVAHEPERGLLDRGAGEDRVRRSPRPARWTGPNRPGAVAMPMSRGTGTPARRRSAAAPTLVQDHRDPALAERRPHRGRRDLVRRGEPEVHSELSSTVTPMACICSRRDSPATAGGWLTLMVLASGSTSEPPSPYTHGSRPAPLAGAYRVCTSIAVRRGATAVTSVHVFGTVTPALRSSSGLYSSARPSALRSAAMVRPSHFSMGSRDGEHVLGTVGGHRVVEPGDVAARGPVRDPARLHGDDVRCLGGRLRRRCRTSRAPGQGSSRRRRP